MTYLPCRERRFALKLAPEFVNCYARYAHWLRHLLERLGREPALKVWRDASQNYDEKLLAEILSGGWQASDDDTDVASEIAAVLSRQFAAPVETVTQEQAQHIIEHSPPLYQIMQRFSSLNLTRQTSTYESLHLFLGGFASLAQSLLQLYGKQGELVAYDAMLHWVNARQGPAIDVRDFLAQFAVRPEKPNRITAGLEYELVRATEQQVVLHVKECEWARYYRGHYPEVGYMLACSMDETEYRAANPRIRMQRTKTLMEGGDVCDFRIYAIDQALDSNQDSERTRI